MTTDKTIEEMNAAIADFMELPKEVQMRRAPLPTTVWRYNHYWVPAGKLKYHEDWNQLMGCVEKIESIHDDFHGYFGVHINSNGCTIQGTNLRTEPANLHTAYHHEVVHDTKILATHKAIYDFIIWYTTTKQKD